MTTASPNVEGIILKRSEIRLLPKKTENSGIPWNQKYICIFKHSKWRWEALSSLSANNLKKYKNRILDYTDRLPSIRGIPIEIKGCDGGSAERINGIYTPIPEELYPGVVSGTHENFQIYKNTNATTWLYQVIDSDKGTFKWWIGIEQKMKYRKAWGFCRSDDIKYTGGVDWTDIVYQKLFGIDKLDKWKIWHPPPPGADEGEWKKPENTFSIDFIEPTEALNKSMNLEKSMKNLQDLNNTYIQIITICYNNISTTKRQHLLETTLKNVFKKASLCSLCLSSKTIVKCLHLDCIGCCKDCFNEHSAGGGGDGTCCACKKPQILQCPICLDEHTKQYLKILNCKHCVCWKCFCHSYEAQRPLKKCPICRAKMN